MIGHHESHAPPGAISGADSLDNSFSQKQPLTPAVPPSGELFPRPDGFLGRAHGVRNHKNEAHGRAHNAGSASQGVRP